jgi:hypothetical protein
MMNILKALLISLVLILSSCENDDFSAGFDALQGNWIVEEYADSIRIFSKVSKMPADNYCLAFDANNIIEQKNSGFCGTPPISYARYDGKWKVSADSVLTINTTFWGGDVDYSWKVLWVSSNKFSVKVLKENYSYKEK